MNEEVKGHPNNKISRVAETVIKMFPVDLSRIRGRDPFHTLVAVILSQKTNTKNVQEAMERFRRRFKSIKDVSSASLESLQDAIRPAGLWRMKAPRIKLIAQQLAERKSGLKRILSLPYPEAKRILSSMRGVGPKTADVFLMIVKNEPVLPIDTHIFRIMKRLGIAEKGEGYETLRRKLESAVKPEKRMFAHLALIEFGRRICRARNPRCDECPFSDICPSSLRKINSTSDRYSFHG